MASMSVDPNLPAGKPPPGVTPNFVNPPSRQTAIIILEAIFTPLMLLAVAARVWVRTCIVRLWGAEDTTCILAACGSIAHMIIYTQTFPLGLGHHMWDIRAVTLLKPSSNRTFSANGITFPWTLCFAKISILLLYKRLFPLRRELIAVSVGIVVDAVLYAACVGVAIGSLIKCSGLEQVSHPYCRFNSGPMVIIVSVINVVTDFYVLILPIPRLLHLQVSQRRKIALLLTFATGLGACAASLARLINFSINYHSTDVFWIQGSNAQLSVVEMNIAIIVACATCLPIFFTRVRSLGSSIYHSTVSLLRTTRQDSKTGPIVHGRQRSMSNNGPASQHRERVKDDRGPYRRGDEQELQALTHTDSV